MLSKWLAKYNISSHTISAAILGFFGVYTTVEPVKTYVDGLMANHKNLTALFAALVGVFLKYSHSSSKTPDGGQ